MDGKWSIALLGAAVIILGMTGYMNSSSDRQANMRQAMLEAKVEQLQYRVTVLEVMQGKP